MKTPEVQPVEDLLERLLSSANQPGPIGEAMRYAVFGGAGRIRPILALRVGAMLESPLAWTVRAAAAVEMLHCASLIVDDLPCMDNAMERRGRPAAHIRFGEATAVLAAHCLVAVAARCVLDGGLPQLLHFQARLLDALDANGLCGGQRLDLDGCVSAAKVAEMKTVPLFRLAVEAGAVGGGERWDQWRLPLRCFAREMGLAYQMTDDMVDGARMDRRALEAQYEAARRSLSTLEPALAKPILDLLEGLHAPQDCGYR